MGDGRTRTLACWVLVICCAAALIYVSMGGHAVFTPSGCDGTSPIDAAAQCSVPRQNSKEAGSGSSVIAIGVAEDTRNGHHHDDGASVSPLSLKDSKQLWGGVPTDGITSPHNAPTLSPEYQPRIVYGVLTAPELLEERLMPLLSTSLRDQEVFVFYPRGNLTTAQRESLEQFAKKRTATQSSSVLKAKKKWPTAGEMHIVDLPPLANMKMSLRNAWVDIPGLAHMIRETQASTPTDWYSIVDDDTYVFTRTVERILKEYNGKMNETLYLGDQLEWGRGGGWRVVRRNGKRTIIPSSKRTPVAFVVGGGGIFINHQAAMAIAPYLRNCSEVHMHPAGDIRLGACFQERNISITRRREFVKDNFLRSLGELKLSERRAPCYIPFPASFHRLRSPSWFYALHAVEENLAPNEVVSWDDLKNAFPVGGGEYYHSYFYPRKYENFTKIYGSPPKKMAAGRARKLMELGIKVESGNPRADGGDFCLSK